MITLPKIKIGDLEVYDARKELADDVFLGCYVYPQRPVPISVVSIHHWGNPTYPTPTMEAEFEELMKCYTYHRRYHRWVGIGYHLVVFPSGNTYLVGDLETQRAAVGGQNHNMVGVCLYGNFEFDHPVVPQLIALNELLQALNWEYDIVDIRPHRAWGNSACPGATFDWWFEWCCPGDVELLQQAERGVLDIDSIVQIVKGRLGI